MLNQKIIRFVLSTHLVLVSLLLHSSALIAAPVKIQTMPEAIKHQICRDLSPDKKGCGADDKIKYLHTIKLHNNQLLLFFYLQDEQKRYHRGLSIPLKINQQGEWLTGSALVGEPQEIVLTTDKLKKSVKEREDGLWMHAQFDNAGKKPILLYSKEGLDWVEVNLPEDNQKHYQLESISRFCLKDHKLSVILKSLSTTSAWTSDIIPWTAKAKKLRADVLTAASLPRLKWQKTDTKSLSAQSCESNEVTTNNNWVIQDGETLTLLSHNGKDLSIKISHDIAANKIVKEKPVAKDPVAKGNVDKTTKDQLHEITEAKLKAGDYAIQVGAYSNYSLVSDVIAILQKADFVTFTKVLDDKTVKNKKIKKIYIGPYQSRAAASKQLAILKSRLSSNKIFESAFIVNFNTKPKD